MERSHKIWIGVGFLAVAFAILFRRPIKEGAKTVAGAVGATRGLRNNNPGNITKTDITWHGEVQGFDSRFETFDTLDNGIRALLKLIKNSYLAKGFDTPSKFLNKYAPASENDTEAYINSMTEYLSSVSTGKVGPNTVLNANLTPYIANIIMKVENGVWVSTLPHIKELYAKL